MLNCKEIVRLISSKEKLNFIQRAELKMHLLACKHCSNYNKQMKLLAKSIKKIFSTESKQNKDRIKVIEDSVIEKLAKKK